MKIYNPPGSPFFREIAILMQRWFSLPPNLGECNGFKFHTGKEGERGEKGAQMKYKKVIVCHFSEGSTSGGKAKRR